MLTEKELQWLDNRGKFPCWYCPDIPQAMCTMGERPAHCAILDTDYKDAAEFSERVAARLASWEQNLIIPCMETAACERHPQDCPWCRLKYARLQVEMEMDSDDQ